MKIRVLATDGSPLGVSVNAIYGLDPTRPKGVGGSELAILTLMEEWHKIGHEVIFFNNPTIHTVSPFEHRPVDSYDPAEKSDVDIVFRTPNHKVVTSKAFKVWFSHDQYTSVNFDNFDKAVNKVVCISPFHQNHFKSAYGINDTVSIDLPVRVQDYERDVAKVPYRCTFTSVPDRGLALMPSIWTKIKKRVPGATLVITSDYRLWGTPTALNEHFRAMFMKFLGEVQFLGAVTRDRLCEEQLKSTALVYPSCLLPSTLVNTEYGSVEIQDLKEGDEIIVGDGSILPIKQKTFKHWDGDYYRLHLYNNMDRFAATKDHKVLSVDYKSVRKKVAHHRYKKTKFNIDVVWKEVKDISENDYVAVPKYKFGDLDIVTALGYFSGVVGKNGKVYCKNPRVSKIGKRRDGGIPQHYNLTKEFGLLCGYILAEGSHATDIVTVTFSNDEEEWIQEVCYLGEKHFGIVPSIYRRDKYSIVTFCSKALARFFSGLFNKTSPKEINPNLMRANKEFMMGLMIGLWRGDACVGQYDFSLVTSSSILAEQVRLIMSGFNWCASKRENMNSPNKSFSVRLFSKDAKEFSDKVGKKEYVVGNRFNSRVHKIDDYFLIPVVQIDKGSYSGIVYDLGIDHPNHSFSSCGIVVHNCYDELFCISIAEAAVAGAVPITSEFGACITTNQWERVEGDPRGVGWEDKYVDLVEKTLLEFDIDKSATVKKEAIARFHPNVILKQWNEKVFK